MTKVLMIDPPSGWQYGFPKPVPFDYNVPDFELNTWLVSQGYPQSIIDEFDGKLPCRFFGSEIDE